MLPTLRCSVNPPGIFCSTCSPLKRKGKRFPSAAPASPPLTTALRWVTRLEEEGLIERSATGDRRRINVQLTRSGRERVERIVVAMAGAQKARPSCHREAPNGR
jgi:hypothetical protein